MTPALREWGGPREAEPWPCGIAHNKPKPWLPESTLVAVDTLVHLLQGGRGAGSSAWPCSQEAQPRSLRKTERPDWVGGSGRPPARPGTPSGSAPAPCAHLTQRTPFLHPPGFGLCGSWWLWGSPVSPVPPTRSADDED